MTIDEVTTAITFTTLVLVFAFIVLYSIWHR
jgi:hypothetical protein